MHYIQHPAFILNPQLDSLWNYNPVEELPWHRPSEPAQEAFLAALEQAGVATTLRREKGLAIDAACSQLRLRTERELSEPT